jgi:GTP-binding protein
MRSTSPFERDGQPLHADRHGRRAPAAARCSRPVEKFSVIKTLQAIEDANVVSCCSTRRRHLRAGRAPRGPRSSKRAARSWSASTSGTPRSEERARRSSAISTRKLAFLDFAAQHYISAREAKGVGALMKSVDEAYAAAMARLPTPRLTRALQLAVQRQQPPRAGMVRPKMRYAHQGGVNPPLVVIHGSALGHVPDAYRRYLEHFLTDAFQLRGTPLRIQFKTGVNPYADSNARR